MKTCLSFYAALAVVVTTNLALAGEPTAAPDANSSSSTYGETTINPFSLALLAGHGFKDAFSTGFGGRLGYTLPNKIYIGGSGLYHVGTKTDLIEVNAWYAGGEVGYDLAAGPFVIRPYAGVGAVGTNATVTLPATGSFPGAKSSASDSRLGFWPGAAFLLPFEEGAAFVGIDAKFLIVDEASAFNAYGTFGLAL